MISGKTKLVAILADPIKQVRTPEFVNAIYKKRGDDLVMVPMHVGEDSLTQVWSSLKIMKNFQGMVVTVPHKTVAASLCDEISEVAKIVGAVNVVRKSKDGRFIGDILDGEGFYSGLLSQGINPKILNTLLVGSGGAGSAIAYSLAMNGVKHLTISNRTKEKSEDLINKLTKNFPEINATATNSPEGIFDLIINATSLGMDENDPLPIADEIISKKSIVAEIIMKPKITKLLELAKNKGCKIHYGEYMLISQSEKMAEFIKNDL